MNYWRNKCPVCGKKPKIFANTEIMFNGEEVITFTYSCCDKRWEKEHRWKEICKRCGGIYCKKFAGINSPKDFSDGITRVELKIGLLKAFRSNLYAIDRWEGNFEDGVRYPYFVRPCHKDRISQLVDFSWGGECIFLTNDGCKLVYNKRPYQCRMLEPSEDLEYKEKHDKKFYVRLWMPFKDLIEELMRELL